MQKAPRYPGRWFVTIDGNYTKGDRLNGYCFHYKGLLSDALVKKHKCKHKCPDGSRCKRYMEFEKHTNGDGEPKPVGEDFRKTL